MDEVFKICKFYQNKKNIKKMILKQNQVRYNGINKRCLKKNTLFL